MRMIWLTHASTSCFTTTMTRPSTLVGARIAASASSRGWSHRPAATAGPSASTQVSLMARRGSSWMSHGWPRSVGNPKSHWRLDSALLTTGFERTKASVRQ
jgi:hypothetical protein